MIIPVHRRAKIVATLGPSSHSKEILLELIRSGIDVARLNFSHGTHQSHEEIMNNLESLSADTGKHIVILQDLQGPKLRVGTMPKGGLILESGEIITFEEEPNNKKKDYLSSDGKKIIYLDIPDVLHCLKIGNKILLDDGKLEFQIVKILNKKILAEVILGGVLLSNKGVNLPDAVLDLPGFTEKDKVDLAFGLEKGIDAVAISFVRSAADIYNVKDFIISQKPSLAKVPIIAKIELPEAVRNLEEILDASDGVMVARGDLGVETSPSEVPIIQKRIIQAANRKFKIVITATQMLDSMVNNPRPTRAEASDVANAILDGSDALMLSSETASGNFPIESVRMMDSIILNTEQNMQDWGHYRKSMIGKDQDDAIAISIAGSELANDREVTNVAVFTQSGRSALLQSKARPDVPILAFTPVESTFRQLGLYWGVFPFLVPFSNSIEEMIRYVENVLINKLSYSNWHKVVFISGFPIGAMRSTNLAMIHTIGSLEY